MPQGTNQPLQRLLKPECLPSGYRYPRQHEMLFAGCVKRTGIIQIQQKHKQKKRRAGES